MRITRIRIKVDMRLYSKSKSVFIDTRVSYICIGEAGGGICNV